MLRALERSIRQAWPLDFQDSEQGMPPALARALHGALWVTLRLRMFGVAVSILTALMFIIWEPTPWRVLICVGAAVFHGSGTLRDLRRTWSVDAVPRQFRSLLGADYVTYTALTLVTGGIESPGIIGFVPVAMLAAIAGGKMRVFLKGLFAPMIALWGMAFGRYLGLIPYLVPDMFAAPGPPPPALILHTLGSALVVTVSLLVGGMIALILRQALDQAILSSAEARTEAIQAMNERNAQLVQVAGAVAHELKNPLASVRGLAGLLGRRFPRDSRQARQVDVMVEELMRMGRILDELFTFSRPFGRMNVETASAAEIARDLVLLWEGQAEARGLALELNDEAEGTLRCDPSRVRQLLSNLMQNALDATPAGGRIQVEVATPPGGGAVFRVIDSGVGLRDDVRGRLFTRGATTKTAGSGLGLVIARSIAERHGGSLSLEEGEGGGCRATLTLPPRPPTFETED